MDNTSNESPPPRGLVVAAFAAVYVIWGSTYLGIRIAIETMPPFLMAGSRFLIAGAILYTCLRLKRVPAPGKSHWLNAVVVGGLLLAGGNGGVTWAEQVVPSSLAALMIAMVPLWIALLDWVRPGGLRPVRQSVIGILIGFAGMMMLVGFPFSLSDRAIDPVGALVLMGACLSWSLGSLYARYTPKPPSALMGIAQQMILGGGLLLLAAWITGEPARLDWAGISSRSLLAYLYLIGFGSLIGFTAYSWLLKASTPARVSTYAYVNPVIAVFLGWAIAGEALSWNTLRAAAVILLGVIIITTPKDIAARPLMASRPKEARVPEGGG
jgi:drug/metabolite transporter (DMT)-like permease